MKKGFTMIELIFVIVILGILASVAIPRLAATREDAEISTTIANLRTLVSEASAYYVAHGTFGTAAAGARWNEVTNVPLNGNTAIAVSTTATPTARLQAGRENCIGVRLVNKAGAIPAHIIFTGETAADGSVCAQVLASAPVANYLRSTVTGATIPQGGGAVAVGSSTGIYQPATPTPTPVPGAPGGGGGGGVGG
ncbi:MAG: prepilin-type N-terminal cleavage/methylation domain-containing protein [Campylobacter sp.]|uniref:type II secretion system protein n=1 Tax=Campylobacter sp. TaxID=205 RepID=UPI002AA7DFA7|nr:prepilin-type N-terminal cleavage/methylation domain-containing protein [Campylobacter sp.]MCI7023354.1 prepilin-type N-terminal cleavage/methylation domain-containing protein [Campylobacter sp.]